MIHPTALVSPAALLGQNVEIGPFAVIEAGVEVGDGCIIHGHAQILSGVKMGEGNEIGHGSVIGGLPQDIAFKRETPTGVRLGNRNRIREHCTIHRATVAGGETRMGDDCYLMATAHMGHDSQIANHVILANGAALGGFVQVEDRVFLGGGAMVHQHCRVGCMVVTQGMTKVSKNIPPYLSVVGLNDAVGLNVVGLRRAGITSAERQEIKRAFSLLYLEGLNTSQALAKAGEQEWTAVGKHFWEFIANSSKRGISQLRAGHNGGEE